MQRRPKNSCGIVGFQCMKVNTLLESFKNLELQKVTYLASSNKLLQTIQAKYKDLLSEPPPPPEQPEPEPLPEQPEPEPLPEQPEPEPLPEQPEPTQLYLTKDTIAECYNNFLNLPRFVQGVVYKTDVTDLSQIETKLLSGYCTDNLNILSFKDTIQQEQMYSKSFTDLYKSIKEHVQSNDISTLDPVILKVVSDQVYVQNQQSGESGVQNQQSGESDIKYKPFYQPYNNIAYNKQQGATYVYRQHKPGVLIPRIQPQKVDFSSASFVTAPSYVVSSIQNIANLKKQVTNVLENWPGGEQLTDLLLDALKKELPDALKNELKNWQGCSGPGVFLRQAQGQAPTFTCLIQCL